MLLKRSAGFRAVLKVILAHDLSVEQFLEYYDVRSRLDYLSGLEIDIIMVPVFMGFGLWPVTVWT